LSYKLVEDDNGNVAATLEGLSAGSSQTAIVIRGQVQDINGNTYDVTSIGIDAFYDNELKSVSIPNSVTNIGDYAFEQNSLETLAIPNSVINIGAGAFARNSLNDVTIPNSVTSIGKSAFEENNLTSVTFLGDYSFDFSDAAFTGNPNLTTIEVCQGKGWDDEFGFFTTSNTKLTVTLVSCSLDIDAPSGLPIWLLKAVKDNQAAKANL
jgi:hypothetical protein